MKPRQAESLLVALSALLWLIMTGLAWAGAWFPALFVLLLLMAIYGLLGVAHGGRFDLKLLAFPVLPWIVVWAGAFALAQHYAERFAGAAPDFTILGFHPSFACIIVAYWLVGTLVMTLGFYWRRDSWLSSEDWDEFLRSVHGAEGERPE